MKSPFQTESSASQAKPDQPKIQTDLERKSSLLRSLTIGLLAVHLAGLMVMIVGLFFPEPSDWRSFVMVGVGILLYLGVFFLNQRRNIQAAVYILLIGFNIEIFFNFFASLIDPAVPTETSNFVAYLLSLAVMLSGMLVGSGAPFWFAGINTAAVFLAYNAVGVPLRDNASYTLNLFAFLILIALISWLYQRILKQTDDHLRVAQRKLLDTKLMQRDLEIAREVQEQLFPPSPEPLNGVHLTGFIQPARETSGDFYDFIPLDAGRIGVLIGDVTGKSLAAALLMTMTRSILRNEAGSSLSPAHVLMQANQTMLQDAAVDQMVTVFYGVLDTESGVLHYANAGHPFALLKRGREIQEFQLPGLPLGAIKEAVYDTRSIQLKPGDVLILFSDGIPEAMNPQNELFGFERLQETFRQADSSHPEQIRQAIWQSVESFQQGVEQSDDMALVIVNVAPKNIETAQSQPEISMEAIGAEIF